MNKINSKKGYYFSIDALMALLIILSVVLFIKPPVKYFEQEVNIHNDLINSLSSIKIGEIENDYVKTLISNGEISDLNITVLDQIGAFYAVSSPEAYNVANSILEELNLSNNIGIYFNNILIASSNKTSFENAIDVWTARQIISGIEQGDSVKGFSSRAFLSSLNNVKYFYFGGYVGDGNISVLFDYNGSIIDGTIEAAIDKPFELYINNNLCGSFTPYGDKTPYVLDLSPYKEFFHSGTNIVQLKGNNLHIGGGYIKISYESSELYSLPNKKYLPGIRGAINLYDSLYIPGEIESIEVNLHFNSTYKVFFNIGNKTIFNQTNYGETSVNISNSQLMSLIDYNEMSKKTVPIRFGMENVSYLTNLTLRADIVSVTDISGSMDDCQEYKTVPLCQYTCRNCIWIWCWDSTVSCQTQLMCTNNPCGSSCSSTSNYQIVNGQVCNRTSLDFAKEANRQLISEVLNTSNDNQLGLVAYHTSAEEGDLHNLSKNITSLTNKVNNWTSKDSTCICCGINKAVRMINSTINSSRAMIVMSDGEANVKCSQQGTNNASLDAIMAACQAHQNYNITVHAIGFGIGSNEYTMQQIASCGGGNYYYSSVEELSEIYKQVAQDIIAAIYAEQTINLINGSMYSEFFPDSYISFSYNKQNLSLGVVINSQSNIFGNNYTNGSFFIPSDAEIIDANVISYSGSKWTSYLGINNMKIFSLADYGNKYIELGDPYSINIPVEYIGIGENNVSIYNGINPSDYAGGNNYSKAIYTILRPINGFSPIVASASGCIWEIEYENGENATFKIPVNYSGSNYCYYKSDIIAYNENDAISYSAYDLISKLDLDENGMIETSFSQNDLTISTSEISGIPFTWETEVQARVWR